MPSFLDAYPAGGKGPPVPHVDDRPVETGTAIDVHLGGAWVRGWLHFEVGGRPSFEVAFSSPWPEPGEDPTNGRGHGNIALARSGVWARWPESSRNQVDPSPSGRVSAPIVSLTRLEGSAHETE